MINVWDSVKETENLQYVRCNDLDSLLLQKEDYNEFKNNAIDHFYKKIDTKTFPIPDFDVYVINIKTYHFLFKKDQIVFLYPLGLDGLYFWLIDKSFS